MLDKQCRAGRRSALVALELKRLGVDIAALSEVRFADEGSLQEHGAGYTLFWSGKPETERRLSGVGFMIRSSIASKLENLPTGHSDRIMSMRLPLKNGHATMLSVYSPTLQADPTEKEKFYTDLRDLVRSIPADDKIIILGDFNARVGQDAEAWGGVLGKHGIGKRNENGLLLLEFCAEQQLTITNTIFQQKNRLKTTWMHPRSKHWHLIDYILVRQKDIRDVMQTRVMPSADCHTDHRLVRSKLRLHFKPSQKRTGICRKKFRIEKFQSAEITAAFQSNLQAKLETSDDLTDPCRLWDHMKSAILQSSEEILGFSKKKNRDWFDENNSEILDLLSRKRSAHQSHLALPSCPVKREAFRSTCSTLQRKLREMQNNWWTNLAKESQLYADTGDYRRFYESLKTAYGPSHRVQSPLRSVDGGTLLTHRNEILDRWSNHFETLFSAERVMNDQCISRIPQLPVKSDLDEEPTLEETIKAIHQLKSGKAAGGDGIPAEVWKHGGKALQSKLHQLFICCWNAGQLPKDLRDAIVITLYKNKGDKSDCSNYRGITLLAIAGKILARILLNRLIPAIAEDILPESQCGFRANRGTTDMVFVLRQLQEKCVEQNKGLYITFVDLTKAFDTVNRAGLWQILERIGCPPKFLNMIVKLHEDQQGQVRQNSDLSKPFPIGNGVKQGCVLAPTLFSIFFSMMLKQATADLSEDDGIYIRYRMDGSLFNVRRLKAQTKTFQHLIRELLFADDAALVAHTEVALQRQTACFAETAELFGLQVSLRKTEVLHQPAPRVAHQHPHILIGNTELKSVDQFKYLGCVISSDGKIDKDIENRLAKANCAFGMLQKRVWRNKVLKNATKISVYKAVVLPTLLYGSESWVLYRRHIRLLERFHQRSLRSILHIKWMDLVPDTTVLETAHVTSIESLLLKSQMRWVGHVSRMEDCRLPKMVFYGELKTGWRERGAPNKRYKDNFKNALINCRINQDHWAEVASDRDLWRQSVHRAVTSFEENRIQASKEKRRKRKEHAATPTDTAKNTVYVCSNCNRACLSQIGLFSHKRKCTAQ